MEPELVRGSGVPETPEVLAASQATVRTLDKSSYRADGRQGWDMRDPVCGGGCASEVWKRALFWRPLLGTRREPHLRAMSRRKQAKPQHLCSLEPQPECKEPGRAVPRVAGERSE